MGASEPVLLNFSEILSLQVEACILNEFKAPTVGKFML